jgi:hypothetical protein
MLNSERNNCFSKYQFELYGRYSKCQFEEQKKSLYSAESAKI